MSGSVPVLTASVVPTGGAVLLTMPTYSTPAAIAAAGTTTLFRQAGGGSNPWVLLYSGPPLAVWVDPGDGLPSSLQPAVSYSYQLTDANGTAVAGPLLPVATVSPAEDTLTQLVIRLLQAGVNNLVLPVGVGTVQVTTQMPLGGWQALPFIVVNLDLLQQQDTNIGEDFQNPNSNNKWTIPTFARYIWRISILSRSASERDYYRNSIIMLLRVLKASVFAYIGSNMRHDIQAASGVDVNEWEGKAPGFYYADVMFTVEGALDAIVTTNYGLIESFAVSTTVCAPQ